MHLAAVTASIPSPSFNQIHIGPLDLRMYGLCIALGVIAAVWLSSRRWEARGGNPDDIGTIALWAVPAGVIGARMYHVATDWELYRGRWIDTLKITQGGLGIPGGILAGVLAGLVVVKIKKLPAVELLDVVAPALPLAQAIGRFGNYFNQEVFGRPTSMPWGLRIDPAYRPEAYLGYSYFHPTFAYEGLWNIGLMFLLLWLDKHKRLRRGELFTLYVFGYSMGRFWVESLRSDHASLVLGLRVNIWMSLIVGLVALGILIRMRMRGPSPDDNLPEGERPGRDDVEGGGGEAQTAVGAAADPDDEVEDDPWAPPTTGAAADETEVDVADAGSGVEPT